MVIVQEIGINGGAENIKGEEETIRHRLHFPQDISGISPRISWMNRKEK